MARIRSGKPEFWTDPKMVALPRDVRFTFKGIWEVSADDWGRFQADPRLIKGQVWPLDDDITLRKLAKYLDQLAEAGVIVLYMEGGIRYGFIRNWFKHQRIDHPADSTLPPPPEPYSRINHETYARRSRKAREAFAAERSGAEGIGEGEEKERSGWEGPPHDPDPMNVEPEPRPPAPRVDDLPWARRFLDTFYDPHLNSTENRRMDAARQLYDTVDPEKPKGARLHKGEYVRARDKPHLEACCKELVEDPARIREPSMAIVVLLKMLKDPPKGPSPAEIHARDDKARLDEETAYQAAMRQAGISWARDHPTEFEAIRKPIDAQYAGKGGTIASMARAAVLAQETARAAGFPSFDEWTKQKTNGAHP